MSHHPLTDSSIRADGGRPTPGVPDVADDESDDQSPETNTDEESPPDTGSTTTANGRTMPGVPGGGSGSQTQETSSDESEEPAEGGSCGSGEDHDHEPQHDLTTAISLRALKRTRSPAAVVTEANTWSDWVGIVGEENGPTMNTFFRRNNIDVDFFNDVSNGPAERLARIDEGHHFYSERRVLVGLPEERAWAEEAGWEFQPFEEVAEEADWTLAEE